MKVFRALKKQMSRSMLVLKKHFGAPADIYFPLKFNNGQHGYSDEDVDYDEGRRVTVLIPALFRKQNQTLELLDAFHNPGDITMFEPNDVLWPRFSKIVVRWDGVVKNYIIDEIKEYNDDEAKDNENVIFRTYILVPSNSIDIDKNRDELIDSLNRELEPASDEEIPPDESLTETTPPSDTSAGQVWDPIT